MNKVILIGRLVRDPELGVTPSNVSFVKFDLAVDRPYNSEKQTREVDFISCVVWRKQAENLHKYCHKGSQIAVEGKIQTRNYTAQDGSKRYITEVLSDNITFLGSANKQEQKTVGEEVVEEVINNMLKQTGATQSDTESDTQTDPFAEFGEEVVINDDDLPFD